MITGGNAEKLLALIKKAIDDLQITGAEYEEIMAIAHEDGILDLHERQLFSELQEMIANRSLRRVP